MQAVVPKKPGSSLSDVVVDQLREAIMQGVYVPGQRLVEVDLIADFSASRGAVREAIRRLAAEGIIELIPNRGAVVKKLTLKEFADLFRMREALEGLAARLAAEQLDTQARRTAFKVEVDRLELDRPDNIGVHFGDANRKLHQLIVDYAANQLLSDTLRQLRLPLVRLQIRAATDLAYRAQSAREHEYIIAALLSGDPDASELAMRRHLQAAATRVLTLASLEKNRLVA